MAHKLKPENPHAPVGRYHALLVLLHWVMALCFLLMLTSGFAMAYLKLDPSFKFQLIQWHKSLGVLLLNAAFLRVLVRVFTRHPQALESMSTLDQKAATLGHWLLYILMLSMPLTGWLMVSSSPYGLPTIVFGWFTWPHIAGVEMNDVINQNSRMAHQYLAYAFTLVIAGHIAAVAKHYLIDKENILPRMWFGRRF